MIQPDEKTRTLSDATTDARRRFEAEGHVLSPFVLVGHNGDRQAVCQYCPATATLWKHGADRYLLQANDEQPSGACRLRRHTRGDLKEK